MSGEKYSMKDQPSRIAAIKKQLKKDKRFDFSGAKRFSQGNILNTHKHAEYIKKISRSKKYKNTDLYPDIFPNREIDTYDLRKNKHWMSFYCLDVMTPVSYNTYEAARKSAEAAMTAASLLVDKKEKYAYALCRPSGHHAGPSVFGGYCYFNNAALAAGILAEKGAKTAILDIDYHHGNGTQDFFYSDKEVFTCSIHCRDDYPYFWGYEDEKGEGLGYGKNLNIPLKPGSGGKTYLKALDKAIKAVYEFNPGYLIISTGVDTHYSEKAGSFRLKKRDYTEIGRKIARTNLPVLFCQEGGYHTPDMGKMVYGILSGFLDEKEN